MREYRIIGPPGTGKTFALTRQIIAECERHHPSDILVVSHTNAAAQEIAGRDELLPPENVGTLHSLAFRGLDVRCEPADTPGGLRAFSEANPEWELVAQQDSTEDVWAPARSEGSRLLAEYNRARNRCEPREEWPADVLAFAAAWEGWKREVGRIDFTDMVELALETDFAPGHPAVIVVDELQDCSRLQYRLVQHWGDHAERVITAGDGDQCLYGFSGSDPAMFLDHRPHDQRVLAKSHRVPRAVHECATRWIEQVEAREQIVYQPRDAEGALDTSPATWRYPEPLLADVEAELGAGHTVMVAAACGFMLAPFLSLCRKAGIPWGNRWCLTRGDWNPLGRRGSQHKAVRALLAFLCPEGEVGGASEWTVEQVQAWAEVTKGVFIRNGRARFEDLDPDATPFEVGLLLAEVVAPEHWGAVVARDVGWFGTHLRAEFVKLGQFAVELVGARGVDVLREEPRLNVGSIHSFKGGEADTVFLFPDLSSPGFEEWRGEGHDAVVRQFYVGMTRARERLVLCAPAGYQAVGWEAA